MPSTNTPLSSQALSALVSPDIVLSAEALGTLRERLARIWAGPLDQDNLGTPQDAILLGELFAALPRELTPKFVDGTITIRYRDADGRPMERIHEKWRPAALVAWLGLQTREGVLTLLAAQRSTDLIELEYLDTKGQYRHASLRIKTAALLVHYSWVAALTWLLSVCYLFSASLSQPFIAFIWPWLFVAVSFFAITVITTRCEKIATGQRLPAHPEIKVTTFTPAPSRNVRYVENIARVITEVLGTLEDRLNQARKERLMKSDHQG